LLRQDILRELDLMEYENDKTPNKKDLKGLTRLSHHFDNESKQSVHTLQSLQHAIELEKIVINFNEIDDIRPLKNLKSYIH